ncbi:MAG: hypothetical protein P4L87_18535 [Formivibrio sp.]|nr:hypothetical protein [Formivibrio sp.]
MNQPIYKDPDYVQGQIAGLTALVFAIAKLLPKDEVTDAFLSSLELQRTALLVEPIPEMRLVGLDEFEKQVRDFLE